MIIFSVIRAVGLVIGLGRAARGVRATARVAPVTGRGTAGRGTAGRARVTPATGRVAPVVKVLAVALVILFIYRLGAVA